MVKLFLPMNTRAARKSLAYWYSPGLASLLDQSQILERAEKLQRGVIQMRVKTSCLTV